jgi:cytochrome d ubiquinol oxidase subunit I
MDAEVLARWQFGITTVYHFFFVPVTIGLAWLLAVMQTIWVRTGNQEWLRLVRFFSKLFLINFAAGVVTGIVQEFQFGMNWSEYSRFVGDIFGAPLALEALIAFFMESTFVGLWVFGWNRLPKGVHLATIYLVAIGTAASALFIVAANAWMQNPVGAYYNPQNGRAELTSFSVVMTNPFFLIAVPHILAASFMVGGGLMAGVGGWQLAKLRKDRQSAEAAPRISAWRKASHIGAWVMIVAGIISIGSGHLQGQIEGRYQPMKLAASEGLLQTTKSAPFSIVGIYYTDKGTQQVQKAFSVDVPYVLSILAKNNPTAEVQGINDLSEQYRQQGFRNDDGARNELQEAFAPELASMPVDLVPPVNVSFYSFRLMIGMGMLDIALGILMLVVTWGNRLPKPSGWWTAATIALPLLPLFANSLGWILTEMGRQPWIVFGVLPTWTAVSPGVSAVELWITMVLYTLIYAVIAVVVVALFLREIRAGLPEVGESATGTQDEGAAPLSFAY